VEQAEEAFAESGKNPKTAIVMVLLGTDKERAETLLQEAGGHISALTEKRQKA
jgi:N-acetylmuramic acid 6-phosphate (MurNAc-6-P) etherase